MGYFHYFVTIEYFRLNIEYLWYSFDYKKDGAQRHPQIFNLQSSIFNSGLSGLGNTEQLQAAADYLKRLEEIGVLSSHKVGKENLYLNTKLYEILSK